MLVYREEEKIDTDVLYFTRMQLLCRVLLRGCDAMLCTVVSYYICLMCVIYKKTPWYLKVPMCQLSQRFHLFQHLCTVLPSLSFMNAAYPRPYTQKFQSS